jgi:pseudouridine synthase
MMAPVRLQKHLARAGLSSRRGAEEVILAGRVRVNGTVVRELGVKVDPDHDDVRVDGKRVTTPPVLWLALNKPAGYVCTRRDPQRRPTIYDLLPAEFHSLFTVGRLDADSEGLLLLTNDGDAANRLLHPRYGVHRVYLAEVDGVVGDATLRQLRSGVPLEDGVARALEANRVSGGSGRTRVEITLAEGRKHEVRRMLAACGHPVIRLRRVRYGPVRLGRLRPGEWQRLGPGALQRLAAVQQTPPASPANRKAGPPTGSR